MGSEHTISSPIPATSLPSVSIWGGREEGSRFSPERIVSRLRSEPGLAPGFSRELNSLGRERDPAIFFEGLFALGCRQILSGHPEAAVHTFQVIQESLAQDFPGRPTNHSALSERARLEFNAIIGSGHSGRRFEFLGRTLAREATNPLAMAGMGLGTLAFTTVRGGVLARLLAASGRSWPCSPWGARAVAGTLGFTAENLAFVYSGRILRQLSGQPVDWSSSAQGRELAGSALLLGALRLTGWGTRSLVGRHPVPTYPAIQNTLHQAGMFGGLVLGHRMEEWTGLRPHVDGATTLIDSLAMLLQFNVAGRLTHQVLGPRWGALQRELQVRGELMERVGRGGPDFHAGLGLRLSPAGLPTTGDPHGEAQRRPWIMMAENKGDGSGKGPRVPGDDPAIGHRETLQSGEVRPPEPPPPPRARSRGPIQVGAMLKGRRIGPGGRFEIARRLGEGGKGVVYQAVDSRSGRMVALKVPKGRNTPEDLERIEKEIWISENLSSPWAVTIYDHFELEPGSAVQVPVMEFVEGSNLGRLLVDVDLNTSGIEQRFPLERRLDFFTDLLMGIHDAHQHGITHNDLKPDNLMVTRYNRARILDWGLARYVGDPAPGVRGRIPHEALLARPQHRTATADNSGTIGYMAPEAFEKSNGSHPVGRDIFALGVMLYELVTGKHPFGYFENNPDRNGPEKIPRRVVEQNYDENGKVVSYLRVEIDQRANVFYGTNNFTPPRFEQVLSGTLPEHLRELEQIFRTVTDRDPTRRYPSVGDFREAVLMARPRAMYRELAWLKESIRRDYEQLNRIWMENRDGVDLPPHAGRELHGPIEQLRQRQRAWEQGVTRLLNRLAGITGERGGDERAWAEAHRMTAELNWQILNEQMDYLPREVREDLMEQILLHDRDLSGKNFPTLNLSLKERIPLQLKIIDFETGRDLSSQVYIEVIPWTRETTPDGGETGNYREGSPIKKLFGISTEDLLALPVGYYSIRIQHQGYAETPIPLRITLEALRLHLEGVQQGIFRTIRLLPQARVAQGLRFVHEGEATIGLNIFGHENLMTAYGFPAKQRRIPMLAISRDPVTVGDYKEMVEDVLRTQGPEEAEQLIPRDVRAGQAWRRESEAREEGVLAWLRRFFQGTKGLLARVGRSLLPSGAQPTDKGYQLFWKIRDQGRLRGASRFELVDPSTHLDPNDDPIHLDQPVSFITYNMAESYVRWRSAKDGVKYRLPEIDELEAISRNFFPWNFPWGNILDPTLTVSRQVFADKTMTYPQRVGTHPLGAEFDRDYTVFGTRAHLGNVRELSQTPGEKGTVSVFGGSVCVVPGPFYYPSSRNSWPQNTPLAAGGAFRLVQDFEIPTGEK